MEAILKLAVGALTRDPILSALVAGWLSMIVCGAAVLVLAYWSRLRERAALVNPPQHRLFPSTTRRSSASSKP
jgi:hypothetical protein